ncbi:hypothetical protein PINS_up011241 [Pythium insidiosum]|nr:hypothetical protein PINS_up011241 [Pythium insidiosum]
MVLKLCGGLWSPSLSSDEAERDAVEKVEPQSRVVLKFEKEFRVVFDGVRGPHGLTFQCDEKATAGYCCVVVTVARGSPVDEYNRRCKTVGDYSRVVVPGLRVRMVNTVDVETKAFEDVVRAIEIATTDAQRRGREYTLCFADVFSRQRRADGTVAPKLKTVGKAVLAAQRAKNVAAALGKPSPSEAGTSPDVSRLSASASTQPKMASILNGNASPKVSKWSSVLTAVSTQVKATQADALAADLQRKSADLEQQVRQLRATLKERDVERDEWHKQKAAWEAEKQQLVRDLECASTTPPPAPAPRQSFSAASAVTTAAAAVAASEMTAIRDAVAKSSAELARVQGELETSERRRCELEAAVTERGALVDKLRHDNEALMLQNKELRLEHEDMRRHVEELHSRLVETQRQHNESTEQLATLRRQQARERELLTAVRSEMDSTSKNAAVGVGVGGRRRSSVATLLEVAGDSETLTLVKRLITERDALRKLSDEQQIELSCHETTVHSLEDQIKELEEKLQASQRLLTSKQRELEELSSDLQTRERGMTQERMAAEDAANNEIQELKDRVKALSQELEAEQRSKARVEGALQVLEDKARGKLEQHEKEKLVLTQFKEQLARGFVVTKYSTNGKKSQRMLYSDPQCRWISWRKPSDVVNASTTAANGTVTAPPRADAKAETLDLVAVFHGVKTENLQAQRPSVPSRCLSLVFIQPCRSLDFEVESRERSLALVRGFRLLLEEVNEKRQLEEP